MKECIDKSISRNIMMYIFPIRFSPMPRRVCHIHPVILTISIQMQTQRFILFSRIGIPRQKSSHFRLVIPCPQIDFFRFLVVVLSAVAERVVVFAVRLDFVTERIVLVSLCNPAAFVGQLYHIPMGIGYIVLFVGCLPRRVMLPFVGN